MTQRRKAGQARSTLRAATAIVLGLPLLVTSTAVAPAAFAAPLPATSVTPVKAPAKQVDPALYPDGKYIVVLADKPIATYDGGVEGIAPTKPKKGAKLDAEAENVQQYSEFLETKQQEVAEEENVEITRTYTAAINGFAADLSADQAVELAKSDKVLLVAPDVENAPDYSSIDFLGLDGGKGAWKTQFGGKKNAGKGTVVGVIDTGYAPDNPFFAGKKVKPLKGNQQPKVGEPYLDPSGQIAMLKADGSTFLGECQVGEDFDGSLCNSKVLSARYFADTYLENVPAEDRAPEEVISPVDIDNHGTHTASTAAGNSGVTQTVDGRDFGVSSGVAPEAKISVYKVCWEDTDPDTGGCYSSAAVAAINQAILDGVDVLNYSISGSTTTTTDPVSLAFLSATSAGVFVAVSAGNSGPTASTVNHGAPWLTTVAASTFSYELQGTAEFSDGSKFRGASIMRNGVPASPVVLAADAAAAGAASPALCGPNTLDPAKVAGKIVVCDRGVVDRVAKSAEVARGGGVGMILVNLVDSSTDTDQHAVPTVHVNAPEALELKAKVAANPSITVALNPEDTTGKPLPPTPQIAGFSSRGPLLATDSDLLKPDITAPGVAVLAGVSTVGSAGAQFGFLSGTSMASPHIAGFGALVLAQNPKWSPAAVKSAMMTTAYPLKTATGDVETDVLAVGAGHINPATVLSPGLVYDQSADDYLRFIQGTGVDLGIPDIEAVAARNTNVPSFALGNLTGRIEVTRTVTAITPGIYRATANVPGVKVTVTPSILNFSAAGEKRTFKVSFENQSATSGEFAAGSITWAGQGKKVTSPVAVRPQAVNAPSEAAFTSAGPDGSGTFDVTSGTNTPIEMTLLGLSKADSSAIELVPGGLANGNNASNAVKDVTVPEGTPAAKFSVLSKDPTADFDMFLITPAGAVTQVATADASESITIEDPAPGTYRIIANLYASPDNGPTAGEIDATILGADENNATVTPNPLVLANGSTGAVTLNWTGLTPGSYVGRVSYAGSSAFTYVNVVVDGEGSAEAQPSAELPTVSPADKLLTGPREAITPTGNK
ncbi:protease [Arthrobacter agilis]|uniref:S8 family peptidase n=1 Tax=Arthrobacter agilis TaxID=37921 RepID=UPI000B3503DA|nr:S8 family peptidase [Arthrobacter agilis]OUM43662.1 protease [Arthrobacter agilis]PPB46751.1 protease [Arthrobacter agilis]TPV24907.1 protease [Arthrobacter agilis]VDR31074.1 Minor extracellular protease vpr precursor [Arthrobacter agilis]